MRYHRQELVWGKEKQRRLQEKTVAIVGVGALGCFSAELLARSGVNLLLIDRDVVEESNLQRQVLFTEKDVERSKALAAKGHLETINSLVKITAEAIHLNAQNISLLQGVNGIIDGTDNISTRLLLNDHCRKEKIPFVYGAVIKTQGYVMPIRPQGPCLRCFLEKTAEETCETAGVLNTIVAVVAAEQVTMMVKLLLGEKVDRRLIHIDIWKGVRRELKVLPKKDCRTCQGKFDYLTKNDPVKTIQFCGTKRYQIAGKTKDLREMERKWKNLGVVRMDGATAQFREITLFADGRCLVKAKTEKEALALYDKYVGR